MRLAGGLMGRAGDDTAAVFEVRGEHAVVSGEMGAGAWHRASSLRERHFRGDETGDKPASCITFLSEQAFAPQNTRFWSRRRVWFQFTVGEDKPPMLSVDNRGKGVLSMDCSAKRSPL